MFLPFVAQCRKDFVGWDEGSTIIESIRAINWCGGYLAQINNIIGSDSVEAYNQHLIIGNKQNSARSDIISP